MRAIPFLTRQEIYDRSVEYLLERRRAMLHRHHGTTRRAPCGGSPVARLIHPVDFTPATERVSVRYLLGFASGWPTHRYADIAALRRALLRARVNVYDERTAALLSALEDVYDRSDVRDWPDQLRSIARDRGLDCGRALAARRQAREGNVCTLRVPRENGDR